ncbi:MAG TPA: hypothetical protein VMV18_04135, partial [bacterium]|nr:hypothetical protein [bacterium]
DKIAKPLGLAVKETGGFPKRDEIPGIPASNAAMVAEAFKLQKPGDVLSGPVKSGNGFVIAVLKDHVLPNDADFDKQKGWIEFSLKRAKSTAAFNSWKADALAKAKVTENPRLIRS